MLMIDGNDRKNLCTCLLFMKPVPTVKKLLVLWEKEIIDEDANLNQASLSQNYFGVELFIRSNSSGHSFTSENERNDVYGLPDSC